MVAKLNLEKKHDDELISFRIQLDKEFKKRGLKFSVGDIGELIAIKHFNSTAGLSNLLKSPTGTKNVDALSRNGERYSVKTIKDGSKTGTIYPNSENDKTQLFEFILVVILNDDYELQSLHRFSWKQFVKIRQWDKTMNAWYIPKTIKAFQTGECLYETK